MAKLRLEAEAGELDEDDLTEVNNMLRVSSSGKPLDPGKQKESYAQ